MKKIVMFFCAMALVMPVMSCDDGGGDSKSDGTIHMAIHNEFTSILKVDVAQSGSTDLVSLWTDNTRCGNEGVIPLLADEAFINETATGYTPVDLPAGLFTATYSPIEETTQGAAGCDFGATGNDTFYGDEATYTESFYLEDGESYLVSFAASYGEENNYVRVYHKVDDNWRAATVDPE